MFLSRLLRLYDIYGLFTAYFSWEGKVKIDKYENLKDKEILPSDQSQNKIEVTEQVPSLANKINIKRANKYNGIIKS